MSHINQVMILPCGPTSLHPLHPSKKGLFFPFSLGKKTIYLETQLKGEFTDLNCQSAPCSYRQSRNRIGWWTFIIVNITSLEDKSMLLVPSKRPSLSLYWGTHLKEELTDYCLILKVTRIFPIPTQVK